MQTDVPMWFIGLWLVVHVAAVAFVVWRLEVYHRRAWRRVNEARARDEAWRQRWLDRAIARDQDWLQRQRDAVVTRGPGGWNRPDSAKPVMNAVKGDADGPWQGGGGGNTAA